MGRVIAINLLLIFLPLIIYGAYIIIEKKPEDKAAFWGYIPLKQLFIVGFALMSIFYITQINFNNEVKDGIYHPPIVKDGKIIPGYIEPRKAIKVEPKTLSNSKIDKKPELKKSKPLPADQSEKEI